jgi:hypothetical protein
LFVCFVLLAYDPVLCHYFTTTAMEKQKSRLSPRELYNPSFHCMLWYCIVRYRRSWSCFLYLNYAALYFLSQLPPCKIVLVHGMQTTVSVTAAMQVLTGLNGFVK